MIFQKFSCKNPNVPRVELIAWSKQEEMVGMVLPSPDGHPRGLHPTVVQHWVGQHHQFGDHLPEGDHLPHLPEGDGVVGGEVRTKPSWMGRGCRLAWRLVEGWGDWELAGASPVSEAR